MNFADKLRTLHRKMHADSLTQWPIDLFISLFTSVLDAEEYQPPIWKSYCKYTRKMNNLSTLPICHCYVFFLSLLGEKNQHKCPLCL